MSSLERDGGNNTLNLRPPPAFFPSITTPLQKRVAVIIFPALCQTARIPLFVTQHYAGSTLPGEAWHHIAIEYALQLATGSESPLPW